MSESIEMSALSESTLGVNVACSQKVLLEELNKFILEDKSGIFEPCTKNN